MKYQTSNHRGQSMRYVRDTADGNAGELHAVCARDHEDGTVNLAVLLPCGTWTTKERVPYITDGGVPTEGHYCY